MIASPCKQCNKRRIACHARCERYREWFVKRQVYVMRRSKKALTA
nr:MAG TPA: avirulence protein [Caudoviricetes sp.]